MKKYCLPLLLISTFFGVIFEGPGIACAQANRASITGTVTDPSGALISGVEVRVANVETGVVTTTVSNADGIYVVPNLFPGNYSIEFQKDGFEKVGRPALRLESTQVARIDAALKVGATTESVTVTAATPVLDLERPSVGTNMKGDVVTELPLSIYGGGRFVENFAIALTPGYSPISSTYGATINGGQWFTKDYTVDGTSATSSIQGDSIETGPSMEAVEELEAQTSGLDAQSSITGGGVMSFNLKSGTNKFHGSAFGYGHNELLDANTWTNDSQGLPKTKARAWDYGGSLGGPIFKNKTFFFGTFERYTQDDFRLGGFGSVVPTSAFLGGDFSALLGPALCTQPTGVGPCSGGGTPISVQNNAGQTVPLQAGMIFDPATGSQFTGNVIPSSRFSSVAQKIIPIYQKNYAPETGGLTDNNRLPLQNSPSQTPNQAVVKIDHNLTGNDRLSGSWIYDHRPRTLEDSGGVWQAGSTDGGPLSAARVQLVRSDQYRLSESHSFSARVLNVFNLTYNWYWNGNQPASSGNFGAQLGFSSPDTGNFPLISFGEKVNGFGVTSIGNGFQGDFSGANTIIGDSLTWTKGKHNLTFGGDFHADQINSHSGSGALSFNFTNNTTGAPAEAYGNQVGFGFASFLLGDVTTASETTPFNLYGRQKSMSLFAQDNMKVTPRLTLNMGLRWNYNFRFHEKYGHWANFDLNQIDPTLGIPGTLVFAKNGSDSFEKNEYKANFGPQIGFAYSPWTKVVFRGSVGILYNPVGIPYFNGVPDKFAPGFQGTNVASNAFNWDNGYPGVFEAGNKNVDPTSLFPVVSVDPRALRVGYSDTLNAGVEYELTPNTRVEVSYVGNRGHRLSDTSLAYNQAPTSEFLRFAQDPTIGPNLNGFSNYVCSPTDAASYGIKYPYSGFCGPLLSAIAPYPQLAQAESNSWFYPNLLYVGLPLGQSYYDSMFIDVTKRTGRGLTMDVSYTLSRQEGDTFSSQQEGNGYYTAIQDFSNFSVAAHSLTTFDQTHVVKGFVAYQLPLGGGQRYFANANKIINGIIGGWTVTGLVLYYTGQPFAAVANNPYYPQWGNIYPNYNLSGFSGPSNPRHFVPIPAPTPSNPNPAVPAEDFYMPASVASAPPLGHFGSGPPLISGLRCPGAANENASILKYFPMDDGRYKLSFRAEFYNVFNRHAYSINGCGGLKTQAGAPSFGQILGVNDGPRNGQFAIRFDF